MPNLQRLELCFGRFSVSGLSDILTKCKSLRHLDVLEHWNVKLNGDLKDMCEKLECFRVHHSNYSRSYELRLWWGYWRSMHIKDLFAGLEDCKKGALEPRGCLYLTFERCIIFTWYQSFYALPEDDRWLAVPSVYLDTLPPLRLSGKGLVAGEIGKLMKINLNRGKPVGM
ncbi:hypothetical protein LXL04_018324 [Taraxacum kok-saghyz]